MARFFCIFHALSFKLYFFFDRRFPLIPRETKNVRFFPKGPTRPKISYLNLQMSLFYENRTFCTMSIGKRLTAPPSPEIGTNLLLLKEIT